MGRQRSRGRGTLPHTVLRLGAPGLVACLSLAGLVLVSGTAASAPSSYCTETVQGKAGTWTRRPVPVFPRGGTAVRSYAVEARDPRRQLVTNGVSIMATDDGCTWSEVFGLPQRSTPGLAASAATDRVLEVVVHPRAPEHLWLVVAVGQDVAERLDVGVPLTPAADERRDGTQTVVVHSGDGGASWRPMETPPLPGAPGRLAPAPSHPSILYLPTASGLYASTDAGRTWLPRPAAAALPRPAQKPLDAVTSPVVTSVAVDGTNPRLLHGRTSTAVRSEDGGLTWSSYGLPSGYVTGPFADDGAASAGRLFYGTQDFSTSPLRSWWRPSTGGLGLEEVPLQPGAVEGVPWRAAWSPVRDEMLLATWDRNNAAAFPDVSLYRVSADGTVEDVNDLDLPPVLGVQADAFGGYHLHTEHELISLSALGGSEPQQVGPPQVDIAPFGDHRPAPAAAATLGAPATVQVRPGDTAELRVDLDLPKRPTPLDTYFLIDTSNSFEPDIDALAEGMAEVVRDLSGQGVDAHFGIGELGTRDARRYRRFADIAAPGVELQRGFERLRTGGSEESHLIALHQAATGSGVPGTSGPPVAPGQNPTWRPGSLRTLVVVTDVQFSDEDDPEAPSRAAVYEALRSRDVRVIGLEVVREGGDDGMPGGYAAVEAADAASTTAPTPARRDLEDVAAATGSFAPPGGVDCRDNGTVEIAEGDPLVCTTTALHVARISTLSDVLARVLLSQVDRQSVELRAGGAAEVTPTDPRAWRFDGVDVKQDQSLSFTGAVGCRTDQAGRELPVNLHARVGGRPVASSRVVVLCGDPQAAVTGPSEPKGPEPMARPGGVVGDAAPQGALPLPAPPPLAPAPLGGNAPAPGSAPAPGAASAPGHGTAPGQATSAAGSPAAGVADTTEEQVDLAHATVQVTSTATPRSPLTQTWWLLAAGCITAITAGASLQRGRSRAIPRTDEERL